MSFAKLIEPLQLPRDTDRLINFLTSEEWPFHVNTRLTKEKVLEMIGEGTFDGSNNETYWIASESKKDQGFLRLFDLDDVDDGHPLFDLRISATYRGQGLGKSAVQWLTKYLFEKHPNLGRIAGTTRSDNTAMRKVFRSTGFAKEGHYRKDWPATNGGQFDTVMYGLLREDWESGRVTPVQWSDEL